MLKSLYIKNYALIREVDIVFDQGFNIITGETGAGKSIMLGALGLILGNRADTKAIFQPDAKCVVEGAFATQKLEVKKLFEKHDLDYETLNLLRREITPSGKSRAFVNDTPVSLQVLKALGQQLVDIHSQHSNLLLADPKFSMEVVDAYGQHHKELQHYRTAYQEWKKAQKALANLEDRQGQLLRDKEYWQFQLDELQKLQIREGEYTANEEELERLSHSEKITEAVAAGNAILAEGEHNLLEQLGLLRQHFAPLGKIGQPFSDIQDRLQAAEVDLKELYNDISHLGDEAESDPARIDELHNRQQALQGLFRKHAVEDEKDLLAIQQELQQRLEEAQDVDGSLAKRRAECTETENLVRARAKDLHERRQQIAPKVGQQIAQMLRELGMPDATFTVEIEWQDHPSQWQPGGADKVRFLFTANKGGQLGDVAKVASGGEMSRIMLALKTALAGTARFPTLVFDEIDLGISGEVAIKMGRLVADLATKHQVISITHLPQIAAMGQNHFRVSKHADNDKSYSTIDQLSTSQRIEEISQMIGGAAASHNAVESAKELLQKFAHSTT